LTSVIERIFQVREFLQRYQSLSNGEVRSSM
jgi:hypothetical protein